MMSLDFLFGSGISAPVEKARLFCDVTLLPCNGDGVLMLGGVAGSVIPLPTRWSETWWVVTLGGAILLR